MSDQPNPTIFVVDDDPALRKALQSRLERKSYHVDAFASAEAFLAGYHDQGPAVLLLDVDMPGMSGLDLQRRLSENQVRLPVIFLSGKSNISIAVKAMAGGAVDFLEKPFRSEQLFERVAKALDNDRVRRDEDRQLQSVKDRFAKLTRREREVMRLVVQGLTSRSVAERLVISEKTVALHRAHFMRKLAAGSTADLVRMAIAAGEVPANAVSLAEQALAAAAAAEPETDQAPVEGSIESESEPQE